MLCSWEIETILQQRKDEDYDLDRRRRTSLNAFPGRRFKVIDDILKFRTYAYGQEIWLDVKDMQVVHSRSIERYIEEIEDYAKTPEEIYLVDKLRLYLSDALIREEEAKEERRVGPSN